MIIIIIIAKYGKISAQPLHCTDREKHTLNLNTIPTLPHPP